MSALTRIVVDGFFVVLGIGHSGFLSVGHAATLHHLGPPVNHFDLPIRRHPSPTMPPCAELPTQRATHEETHEHERTDRGRRGGAPL